jgi:hypothetical protein
VAVPEVMKVCEVVPVPEVIKVNEVVARREAWCTHAVRLLVVFAPNPSFLF